LAGGKINHAGVAAVTFFGPKAACPSAANRHRGRMTAIDVIDQIKALPLPERAKVLSFMHELEAGALPVRYPSDEQFNAAAKWVFDEHAELMRKLSQ
jgi:hypothetical protein